MTVSLAFLPYPLFLKVFTFKYGIIFSADDRLVEKRDAYVVVSNGHIFWMPQAILRSSCSFDTTYFPFDEQICHLKFGSWTYDGTKLDLYFYDNITQFSMSDYIAATEWDITENFALKSQKFYDCCPDTPYPDLKFYIRIKRKVAFYSFILILPCLLLSLLTLVIFWVPPESPAKLVLGKLVFSVISFNTLVLYNELSTSFITVQARVPMKNKGNKKSPKEPFIVLEDLS